MASSVYFLVIFLAVLIDRVDAFLFFLFFIALVPRSLFGTLNLSRIFGVSDNVFRRPRNTYWPTNCKEINKVKNNACL